jgi:hypothetical protein
MDLKRVLFLFCFVLVFSSGVFADHPDNKLGLGAFIGGGWGSVGGGMFNPGLSLKIPGVPIFWGFNADIGDVSGIGVSADYYLLDRDVVKDGSFDLDWFLGIGAFTRLYFGDYFDGALGVRLPIGLSWHINQVFELFLDAVPGIGLAFHSRPFFGFLTAELGFRAWI